MSTENAPNYSPMQESRIEEFATANGGAFDNEGALILAAEFGKDVRSVRMKASRMGVYIAKKRESVNGGAVETRDDIAGQIGTLIGADMEGLEKAPKTKLVKLRDFIVSQTNA